jgi:sodium transport system permease protein
MKLSNVLVVYRKELLDALRDKRTLFATIIIPLFLLPVIMVGFGTFAAKSVRRVQEETFNVVIVGEANSPALVSTLRTNKSLRIEHSTNDFASRISNKELRAALEIPDAFDDALHKGEAPKPIKIYHYAGEMRSQFAVRSLQKALGDFTDKLVENRLVEAGLASTILNPFQTLEENVAPAEKVGGNMLGGLVPYLIVFLSFVGAMGPAIDLTAGEKERGTIETILASPVARVDLVLGKFLMVLTASLVTTIVSLSSFAITLALPVVFLKSLARVGPTMGLNVSLGNLFAVFTLLLPLAVMFSAGLLALALVARTFKEAQSYLSPLMMVVLLPAMASMLPGVEPSVPLSFVPVLNVSLISRDVLSGHHDFALVTLVFLSTCIYAAIALAAAVFMFKRESVLFRT